MLLERVVEIAAFQFPTQSDSVMAVALQSNRD
jgi:hypothetical protein